MQWSSKPLQLPPVGGKEIGGQTSCQDSKHSKQVARSKILNTLFNTAHKTATFTDTTSIINGRCMSNITRSNIVGLATHIPQSHSQAHYTYTAVWFPGSLHIYRSLIPRLTTHIPQSHSQAHYTYTAVSFPGSLHIYHSLVPRLATHILQSHSQEEGYFWVMGSCAHLRGSHEDVAVVHP